MVYDISMNKVSAKGTFEQKIIGGTSVNPPYNDPFWTRTIAQGITVANPVGISPSRVAWNHKALLQAQGGQDRGGYSALWDIPSATVAWSGTNFQNPWPFRWILGHSTGQAYYKPKFGYVYNQAQGPPGNAGGIGYGSWSYMVGPSFIIPTGVFKGGAWNTTDTSINAPTVSGNTITSYGDLQACPGGLSTAAVQQGAVGTNCIHVLTQQPCSMTPFWPTPTSGATFTTTQSITASQTSFTVSSVANLTAGTTYITSYVPNTSSETNFRNSFPGFEVMLVTAINGNTITVNRGVSGGYTFALGSGATLTIRVGTSPEAADYPCDHGPLDINGQPMWSLLSTLAPLDKIQNWANLAGTAPIRNRFVVVSSTLYSGTPATHDAVYDVLLSYTPTDDQNEATNCQGADPRIPYSWVNSPSYIQSRFSNSWLNGWIGNVVSACYGAAIDSTNASAGFQYEYYGSGHTAFGFSGTGVGTTNVIASIPNYPYLSLYRKPMMTATNPFVATAAVQGFFSIPSWVGFAGQGTVSSYEYQSYPGQSQIATTFPASFVHDPNLDRYIVDTKALLTAAGGSQGNISNFTSNYNTGSLVGTTNHNTVWLFTPKTGVPDYKVIQPMGYAGRWLAKDISGPGSSIDDTKPYSLCSAYVAGECVSGSAVGNVYVSFPYVGGNATGANPVGRCWTSGQFLEQAPCVISPIFHVNGTLQVVVDHSDPTGTSQRVITRLFKGLGLPYFYDSSVSDPSGAWMFYAPTNANFARNDMFVAKMPPLPAGINYVTGTSWSPVVVNLPASASYDQARVRFGYAENGAVSNYYCTARTDSCVANSSSIASTPFYYLITESPAWAFCLSGCTISVPAIPGRVLYYVVDRKNSTSGTTASSQQMVSVNP